MTELLEQGIAAARAGDREAARALLMRVVEADERNEQAWLWLSGVVDDPEDMRTCLQNALDLNPGNTQARQGLDWVEARYGLPPAPVPVVPTLPDPVEPPASAAPPPDAVPQYTVTGPTTKLPEAAPPPKPVAPPLTAQPVPPAAAEFSAAENPCPYCGAPTALEQQRCTQCRNDLLIRAAPRAKRSTALTILGILWGIGGVLSLIGAAFAGIGVLIARSAPRNVRGATSSIDILLVALAIAVAFGLLYIMVARGLLARQRWAYYLSSLLITINALGSIYNIFTGAAVFGQLIGRAGQANSSTLTIIGLVLLMIGVLFALLPLLLTIFSYGDFFGPKLRLAPEVEDASDTEHYNNGIAYKNRGMWYMAAQEWAAAVRKKPRDATYLHALGLAYAQIKRFDRARATLDQAISADPNNGQIHESRALIDQMQARAR